MEQPVFIFSVVLTGILIVAGVLLALMLIIKLMSKVIITFEGAKAKPKATSVVQTPKTAPAAANPVAPAPVVEDGIPDEVVAVIAAAVAVATEGKGVPVSIQRTRTNAPTSRRGRPVWGQAGIRQNTMPF